MSEDDQQPDYRPGDANVSRLGRRRARIIAEVQRNRRGEYTVPTWVLTAALVAIVAGIAALIIFS